MTETQYLVKNSSPFPSLLGSSNYYLIKFIYLAILESSFIEIESNSICPSVTKEAILLTRNKL